MAALRGLALAKTLRHLDDHQNGGVSLLGFNGGVREETYPVTSTVPTAIFARLLCCVRVMRRRWREVGFGECLCKEGASKVQATR